MDELSLTIYDIVENSIRAQGQLIIIKISEDHQHNKLSIAITDDGIGMTKQEKEKSEDPFYTTKSVRKIGLGIPLFKMMTEQSGGQFQIISKKGCGTTISAIMELTNIDRPKLGDLTEMLYSMLLNEDIKNFKYSHAVDNQNFVLEKNELGIKSDLLSQGKIASAVKEYISYNLEKIGRGE